MTSKKVITIFYVGFGVVFCVMLGMFIVGMINQNKDEKNQNARYEQLKSADGKTVLTDEILEEDHTKYLEDSVKSRKTFIIVLTLFGTVVVLFFVTVILATILKFMENANREAYIVPLIVFGVIMLGGIGFVTVFFMAIVPKIAASDRSKEGYYFTELSIADTEKKEEHVESGSGENRTTYTRVTYYLIDEEGNKISVGKTIYDRYEGPGTYYAGQLAGGNIFSMYSGKYFELGQ